MPIPFHPAFYPKTPPTTFSNLNFERACVIFNLAALFSQLGSIENRATAEGIKRASGYFQVRLRDSSTASLLLHSHPFHLSLQCEISERTQKKLTYFLN